MVLSDVDIREYMESGDIIITNFTGDLEPASYDLRVGEGGWAKEGQVNIRDEKYIRIERGATVVIHPVEQISLSTKVVARYGLRSGFARQGLILLSGPQIDPGFKGGLTVTVFNAGSSEVVLSYLEKFATIEFLLLKTPASRAYSGPYQGLSTVSSEEVKLVTRDYRNLADIESALRKVEANSDIIKNFIYVVVFGVVVVVAGLIITAAVVLVQEFILQRDIVTSPPGTEIPPTPQSGLNEPTSILSNDLIGLNINDAMIGRRESGFDSKYEWLHDRIYSENAPSGSLQRHL